MAVEIIPVTTKKELREFIRLPWKIYQDDPNWVPPLISEQKKFLDKQKCPFFEHSEADFFLARKSGKTVGRIAAIKNNNHLDIYHDDTGFFGFFEAVDDQEVADALFETAADWLRARGLKKIRGPENYSQNEQAALLIDAFDQPPVIEMTYNPPYYVNLVENHGFEKKIDLYAYQIQNADQVPQRLSAAVKKIKQSADFSIRPVNMRRLDEEVERVKTVYNSAWSENWGAVPMTDKEIEEFKKKLKAIVIPDLVFIAEVDGQPVGVSITIPNLNEALIKLNGRLFPFGIFKLLWYSRKVQTVRTLIMGVLKEHRHKGIDVMFYHKTFENGLKRGFHTGEMSWILENNIPMRKALENIYGSRIYKTYRLYEKSL